jgi:flagellin-specific chaperone FliS
MNELIRTLNKVTSAWELILKTDLERSDLTQMIGDLEEKLSEYNRRIDELIILKREIDLLEEIYQACYQEDSKTIELVEDKLIKLRKQWRELSRRNSV